jgi:hypothetical protein
MVPPAERARFECGQRAGIGFDGSLALSDGGVVIYTCGEHQKVVGHVTAPIEPAVDHDTPTTAPQAPPVKSRKVRKRK